MIRRHWHHHHHRHSHSPLWLPMKFATLYSCWIPKKLNLTFYSPSCAGRMHKPDQVATLWFPIKESQIVTCRMIKAGRPCWPNSQGTLSKAFPTSSSSIFSHCSPAIGASQEVPTFPPVNPAFVSLDAVTNPYIVLRETSILRIPDALNPRLHKSRCPLPTFLILPRSKSRPPYRSVLPTTHP